MLNWPWKYGVKLNPLLRGGLTISQQDFAHGLETIYHFKIGHLLSARRKETAPEQVETWERCGMLFLVVTSASIPTWCAAENRLDFPKGKCFVPINPEHDSRITFAILATSQNIRATQQQPYHIACLSDFGGDIDKIKGVIETKLVAYTCNFPPPQPPGTSRNKILRTRAFRKH